MEANLSAGDAELANPSLPAQSLPAGEPDLPNAQPRPKLRHEWLLLALAVLLLIGIVVPPLANLGRYQHRIATTISSSLGREVSMRAVSLRLLPMPALVLTDLVVDEEPEFGAEPALRAPQVIAQIRLTSLWRGRLEVSRVDIGDASLNLVRNSAGRWNIGSVLLQASHVPNAPTGQRRAGPAPRFPYIEITDSRINVKQGVEKLPYSLLNANLSMWLPEPDVWQIRLDGQPVRTDIELGLSDTGMLRIEGRLHRATALGHMPLALHADWANAPLGQASRLLLGRDSGWRGDLHASGDVSGDLDNLAIKTHVTIANLHREEFSPAEPFSVDATCRAAYSRAAHTLSDLACRWPVGDGQLLLSGSLTAAGADGAGGADSDRQSTLALTVQQLPAGFLVAAAGLAHSDFSPTFRVEGALSGMLFYNAHAGGIPMVAGVLEAPRLRLAAAGLRAPLELDQTRLSAATAAPGGRSSLVLTTAPIDLGGPEPTVLNAQLTSQGFLLHAGGSAAIERLEDLGHASHLLPAALAWLAPQGMADFDVTRSESWQGSEPPTAPLTPAPTGKARRGHSLHADTPVNAPPTGTTGWLRLRDASYRPRFLPEPVTLPAVQATFSQGEIAWSAPGALFHQAPLQLTATFPLGCAGNPGCTTHFRATGTALSAEELVNGLLATGQQGHLIDNIISRLNPDAAHWPAIEGTIHADTFTLGRLALHNAEAEISVADGKATILSLDAQAAGGALHATGEIAMIGGIPHYNLATVLTRANAAALGVIFHENWGAGTVTISSSMELVGIHAEELAASAKGTFHAEWTRGGLGAQTPLARFALWTGDGRIENQALTFASGQLTPASPSAPLTMTGGIAFDRTLSLRMAPVSEGVGPLAANIASSESDQFVAITGTLAKPIK